MDDSVHCRERQAILDKCIEQLSLLAERNDGAVDEELQIAARHLHGHSQLWTRNKTCWNWWRAEHGKRHSAMARSQIESEGDTGLTGRALGQRIMSDGLKIAVLKWKSMTSEQVECLKAEYNRLSGDTTGDTPPAVPRTPTKMRLKTVAKTRKAGWYKIREMLTSAIRYAESNGYDLACFFADCTPSTYGGVLHEQIGTSIGLEFILTLLRKGYTGEYLEVLSRAVSSEIVPRTMLPLRPQSVSTVQAPSTLQSASKASCRKVVRSYLREAVREAAKSCPPSTTHKELIYIKRNPALFQQDLYSRGLKIVFDSDVELTLDDVLDDNSPSSTLACAYTAMLSGKIRIENVSNVT